MAHSWKDGARHSKIRMAAFTGVAAIVLAPLLIPIAPNETERWRLVEIVPSVKQSPIQGERHFTIVTGNSRLSGELHLSGKVRGLLSFRLFRDGQLLWEAPAPSDVVLIPSNADIVIMIGKRPGEAAVMLGRNTYEGFTAFDTRGNEIASVATAPIQTYHLFHDGRLIFSSADGIGLIDFTRHQEHLVWEVATRVHSLRVFPGEQYFSTRTWLSDADANRATLLSAETGRTLHSVTAPIDDHPSFFAVSGDQEYAFLRMTRNQKPIACDVTVYRIGDWSEPFLTMQVEGGPVVADRRAEDGTLAIGSRIPDGSRDPGEFRTRLETRDSNGNILFRFISNPGPIDHRRSFLRFDRQGAELRFLIHSEVFRFEE